MRRKVVNRRDSAFTLIEIAMALVVLGGSLVVLLGLQSSIIERTIRDTKKQRAMLLGRQILAAVEITQEPPEPATTQGSVATILAKVLPQNDLSGPPSEPADNDYQAIMQVESVGIPGVGDNLMRKITVTIFWSPSPFDQIAATLFKPAPTP